MLDYQRNAINKVREQANTNKSYNMEVIKRILNPLNVDVSCLIHTLLNRPITLNFHPDRLTKNGKTVIESLIIDGKYQGQFKTGTTNGGNSAYIGGQRFNWEQDLFSDAYPQDSLERPKYGALNLFNYVDGGAMRFGSCHFELNQSIMSRCTFSYGDSSTTPKGLCTSDTFEGVIANLLLDIEDNKKILNQIASSMEESIAVLFYDWKDKEILGRDLDFYIETHIHGDINLASDVESLFLDSSFKGTHIESQAKLLCEQYDITLKYIPKREIKISSINPLFRGDKIQPLAHKIDSLYGDNQGYINAHLIGIASCDSIENFQNWNQFGTEAECFQYLKQLWHTVGYFG